MGKNSNIEGLNKLGQSIWYDNLSLAVLHSGELARLVEAGVSGLTSNPTIFKKAIADTSDYDAVARQLLARTAGTEELCEELMVRDVGAAADLLRPVYERTGAADGYASIEVSPFLAKDTAGTVEAARRLWGKLARPNIMIKIPATAECIPAIRTAISEGINVNVTLIFSEQVYREVAEAYISGLEARAAKGQPVAKIASVASFFVSRVDAICEKSLASLAESGKKVDPQQFFGKVGIANSKVAYSAYKELFGSQRFGALAAKGAAVQRPLWASTGTKNPKLSPVLYVEELAGKDTVNTVPPQTLQALMGGMTVEARLEQGTKEARQLLAQLSEAGVPFAALLVELQGQGVELFADSYRELLASVEKKSAALQEASR